MASGSLGQQRKQLGKYQIVEHIATGGMGEVYKAVVADSGQVVALKVLSAEMAGRDSMRERLRREAVHGGKLSHENIVEFLEFGEADGTYFLAMEYVRGRNLQEYIDRQGKLQPGLAEFILRQIVAALDHVHQLGFIHRDIKPSNILLTRKDGKPLAKLADLGLIRESSDEEFRLTREGHTVGTVDYLAPEQARDSGLADIRSDIYSLGCTFYHMLTGMAPFAEGSLTERLYKHADIEAADVRIANAKIPAKMAAICRKMLAKKPENRFQTPADLLAELTGGNEVNPDALAEAATIDSPSADKMKKSLAATPTQRAAAAQFALAEKTIADGDLPGALPWLFECCRLDPGQVSYRQALRDVLKKQALSSSTWWRRMQAVCQRLLLMLAKRMGKPLQILERGERVVAVDPQDLTAHLLLAEAALTCRFHDLAWWLLEQAAHDYGPHARLHRAQALFWEHQGNVKKAIYFWELVAAADSENAEARYRLKELSARDTLARGKYQEHVDTGMLDLDRG